MYLYICPAPQLLRREICKKFFFSHWLGPEKHRLRENVIFKLNRCRPNFKNSRTNSCELRDLIFEHKMLQDLNRRGWINVRQRYWC